METFWKHLETFATLRVPKHRSQSGKCFQICPKCFQTARVLKHAEIRLLALWGCGNIFWKQLPLCECYLVLRGLWKHFGHI